ncbi:MAG: alpha/beta hydrolase [Pseudomonadota bacterium]
MESMDWNLELNKTHQSRLPDGRFIGYADYGAADGFPVFYFHGSPGSRLEAYLAAEAAQDQGVRLIAVDRPGYGLSDPKPDRQLLDWPADVSALADSLGLRQFSILGASGGGPYALACAFLLSDRLHRVGLAAGLAPFREGRLKLGSRLGLRFARVAFPLIHKLLESQIQRNPARTVSFAARLLSTPDQEILKRPGINAIFQRSLQEAFRQGRAGVHRDMELYGTSWGFRLEEVTFPIELWHGEADRLLPPRMCRRQAEAMPHARAYFIPNEGHFSLPINCAGDIFSRLRS